MSENNQTIPEENAIDIPELYKIREYEKNRKKEEVVIEKYQTEENVIMRFPRGNKENIRKYNKISQIQSNYEIEMPYENMYIKEIIMDKEQINSTKRKACYFKNCIITDSMFINCHIEGLYIENCIIYNCKALYTNLNPVIIDSVIINTEITGSRITNSVLSRVNLIENTIKNSYIDGVSVVPSEEIYLKRIRDERNYFEVANSLLDTGKIKVDSEKIRTYKDKTKYFKKELQIKELLEKGNIIKGNQFLSTMLNNVVMYSCKFDSNTIVDCKIQNLLGSCNEFTKNKSKENRKLYINLMEHKGQLEGNSVSEVYKDYFNER